MGADGAPTPEELAELAAFQDYQVKRPYQAVFQQPPGSWKIDADWEGSYYYSAERLIRDVVVERHPAGLRGVTGVFLFRHYLELSLKYILLHARWLTDPETNADPADVRAVKNTHSLGDLWASVKEEALPKINAEELATWDVEFVEACINDFHTIDPGPGVRFRYHGPQFGPPAVAHDGYLWIDFARLLAGMPHVRLVLWMIDSYLVETHGMNEEWEAEMNSW